MALLNFTAEKIPEWFKLPNGIFHDFWKNPNFPKNFVPPRNKIFAGGIMMPYNTEDLNGKNPLVACGFSHVDPSTRPHTSVGEPKNRSFRLIADMDWCDVNDGANTRKWNVAKILDYCRSNSLVILDYESQRGIINQDILGKLSDIKNKTRQNGSKLALWAQAAVQNMALYMPKTGVNSLVSARYWAEKYANPASVANSLVYDTKLEVSMPFGYYLSYGSADYLHRLMQSHELSKLLMPGVISMPSLWIQQEHVDNYTLSDVEIKQRSGKIIRRKVKLQAPATYVYGTALWGAVWDGWYHFEQGRLYGDDSNNAREVDSYENIPKQKYKGVYHNAFYPNMYLGYYNYVYLALWQMSQPHIKPIIEAGTAWLTPEYKTNVENQWRQGDERLPSYAHIRKEPIVRYKYDNDGKTVLILAQNPHNSSFQKLSIRDRNLGWETELQLEGGWPTMGTIRL